ncbi:hypothetical protein N2152v2_002781 [Parachlorella kessleri]
MVTREPVGRQQEQVAVHDAKPATEQQLDHQQQQQGSAVPQVGWLWDRKASETRQRLREQNIRPKKSLGQNFLLDDVILQRIVTTACIQPGDLVLEIGPGTGNLTRHLLAAGALVTAVEKDYTLHAQLEAEFAKVPQLRVIQGDILRVDLGRILGGMQAWGQQQAQAAAAATPPAAGAEASAAAAASAAVAAAAAEGNSGSSAGAGARDPAAYNQPPGRVIKVVANLPYNITKDCLLRLLPLGGEISHLYFMLQDEVAVRLTGRDPGGHDWRVMNLIVQYYCRAQYKFQIDRRKYHPAPAVHGAVVDFELRPPHERPAVPSERAFLQLVKKAFSQRRKVIRNSLQPLYPGSQVSTALGALGLSVDARAQDLTLDDFVRLAWQLQPAAAVEADQTKLQQQRGHVEVLQQQQQQQQQQQREGGQQQ